ncbi:MAG: helix-turn-helix domain-containing protein [Rhodospirillales bacterium]|mgnify:CR=1 FL=1|nr:helix-turn-helix domain-containing protein [Rhodospirillales bacterium]
MKEGLNIGELGRRTGTNVETIRYYERIGLLEPPARTAAGYRSYRADDVQRLSFVRRARALGFSLDEIRELLGLADDKSHACEDVDRIARRHLADVEAKIAQLQALRRELQRIIGQCRGGTIADCRILGALSARGRGEIRKGAN